MDLPRFITLKNNLRVCLIQDKNVEIITMHLKGLAGSNEEKISKKIPELGVAHLVEHTSVFNSDIKPLTETGAKILGITSRADVLFMIKILKKDLDLGLKFLSEVLFGLEISEHNVINSKRLSIREIQRNKEKINRILSEGILKLRYKDQRPAYSNLGTETNIKDTGLKTLIEFKKRNYNPQNFVLVISGNFDIDKTTRKIKKQFNKDHMIKKEEINQFTPVEQKGILTINIPNILQSHLRIDYPHIPSNQNDLIPTILLIKILNRRLKIHFRELKGLAYDIGIIYFGSRYWGQVSINIETGESELREIIPQMKSVLSENPVNTDELEVAKKYLETEQKFSFEKVSSRAEYYSNVLLHGYKNQNHKTDIETSENTTLEKINIIQETLFNNIPVAVLIQKGIPKDTQYILSEL